MQLVTKKIISTFDFIYYNHLLTSLVITTSYIIYIGHYFLPIAYVIFILTQRLVPACGLRCHIFPFIVLKGLFYQCYNNNHLT